MDYGNQRKNKRNKRNRWSYIHRQSKNFEKYLPWYFWSYKASRLLHDWPKMKKVIILIPIFNDWQSFKKLIFEIDKSIDGLKDLNLIAC